MNIEDQLPKVPDKLDPTANVTTLVIAAVGRLDDLRRAESSRVNEIMILRDQHATELRLAESKRIDAIREVDVNAVSVANDRAIAQAAILANQVATSAETLRALVATTAGAQAIQLSALTAQLTDRIALLEKSQYERKGTGTGMRDMYGWIFGIIMALVNVGGILYSVLHK
jgi:hypothetical protein